MSARKQYVVDAVDEQKLRKAVMEGRVPAECLEVNWTFLNAQARAFKQTGEIYPGVWVKVEENVAVRK